MHNSTMIRALFLTATVALGACESGSTPGASGSASAAGTTAATSKSTGATSTAKATATAAATAVEMVDQDLSAGDASWAGWTAKGPKDAKVMADGVKGARIAAKGPGLLDQKPGGDQGFDIAFAWGKPDLKNMKTNLEKGASAPDYKMKLEFTKDEAEFLQFKSTVGEMTTHGFSMAMKVDGKDITCQNNIMVGAGNEAELQREIDACKSLAHKK
jgi:hypothetical protein